MTFDPAGIGKRKAPVTNDTSAMLKETDQRWLSEVAELYPSDGKVWDGKGPVPEQVLRKLAQRYLMEIAVRRLVARVQGQ